MPIAADRHGAPAAPMRPGIIVEKEATGGIGAAADGGTGAFNDKFGSGTGNCGEQPLEPTFARDKMEGPGALTRNELVMPLGDAQDFVDRFDPGRRKGLAFSDAREDGAERFAKPERAEQHGIDGLRLGRGQRTEASGALAGDQMRIGEEGYEFIPGEMAGSGGEIGEVQGQAPGDEVRRLCHGTALAISDWLYQKRKGLQGGKRKFAFVRRSTGATVASHAKSGADTASWVAQRAGSFEEIE